FSGNDITFGGTVNSDATPRALAVNSNNSGVTTFGGALGNTSPLAGLVTNADGTTNLHGGTISTVAANGNQIFGDAVFLTADTILSGHDITLSGTVNSDAIARALTINSNNGGTTR